MKEFYPTSKYCTLITAKRILGYFYKTPLEFIASCLSVFFAIVGILTYAFYIYYKDVYGYEEQRVLEAFHWGTFLLGQTICLLYSMLHGDSFIEIDKIIRNGFFDYEEDFTEEMYQIRQDANEFILKTNKWLYFSLISGTLFSFTKTPVFQRKPDEWNVIYHGYIPWEVNSAFRFALVIILNNIHAFLSGHIAYIGMCSFLAVCFHMIAQIKIMNVAIANAVQERDEEKSLKMLKKCVIHHIEIKRCYLLTIDYFSKALGSMPIYSVILICTFLYDVTDPNGTLGAFVLVFVPELSFIVTVCLAGEALTDTSDGMANGIYNTIWYERPVRVRKSLLTIMLACNEPMSISGFDVLPFSRVGLNEVLKTGYTYFNALNAARTLENE